jgi:hypothetical protein
MRTGVVAGVLTLGAAMAALAALAFPLAGHDARQADDDDQHAVRRPPATVLPPGADLQAAIDRARPGETIALTAGATYTGPFRLPRKDGPGWIVIQTSALGDARFAPSATRVRPEMSPLMATLESASGAVLTAAPGAHRYRFIGLEIRPAAGVSLTNLVALGVHATREAELPYDVVFERCFVHGDPVRGSRRGLALNTGAAVVIDSHFSDFKVVGEEAQAIAAWNGPGPFTILNNYLEGAGENIMFGGADPLIAGLVPSDIEIRGNHLAKPTAWRDPGPGQPAWTVKNLLELKNARRVTIAGNLIEHNWPAAQTGFAILFTPRNQDGGAPWSVVEDVTFEHNVVRHVAGGVSILGEDDIRSSRPTRQIRIADNLFLDVGGAWGDGGLFQIMHGTTDVRIEHNTAVHTGTPLFGGDTRPHTGFVFRDNIVLHNEYGIIGSGTGSGMPSIQRYFPDARLAGNAIVGAAGRLYPPDNFWPPTVEDVGFADAGAGDYRLAADSPYRGAGTDGRDVGADLEALNAAIAEALSGRRTSRPPGWR